MNPSPFRASLFLSLHLFAPCMAPSLTDHQRKFVDSLRLNYRGNRDTRAYLHELLDLRREEAATLRAIQARWDALQAATRKPSNGRAQADARQLARGTIRALSSFGLPGGTGSKTADAAEAALRDDSKRDFTLLSAVMREVANPTRPRLAARLARIEEEIAALEILLTQKSPKRTATRVDRLAARRSEQSAAVATSEAPLAPGPLVGTGKLGYGIYREVNAALVDVLTTVGALRHAEAGRILRRYAPYATLRQQEVTRAAFDYLRLLEKRWKELGKEIHLEGPGQALVLRRGPSVPRNKTR